MTGPDLTPAWFVGGIEQVMGLCDRSMPASVATFSARVLVWGREDAPVAAERFTGRFSSSAGNRRQFP